MAVLATKLIVDKVDLACGFGGVHDWDYVRGEPALKQPAVYKCKKCVFIITKTQLKALTDGGSN